MKPKQNHCYGHTPQIQKGAKTSNSGVKRNAIRYSHFTHCCECSHALPSIHGDRGRKGRWEGDREKETEMRVIGRKRQRVIGRNRQKGDREKQTEG